MTGAEEPWVDTGVVVDDRPFATVSVAWTANHLIVVSTGSRSYRSHALRVSEFNWSNDSGRWVLAPDSSVDVTESGMAGTQFMVADDGRIWFARLVGDRVLVARSDPARVRFTEFEPLPDGVGGAGVGALTMVTGGTSPRLVWRAATSDTLTVATEDGSSWTTTEVPVYGVAGLGAVEATEAGPGRPGSLLVLVETSLRRRGANDQDASTILVSVDQDRTEVSVVARASDGLRYPGMLVDRQAGTVHVISVAEASGGGNGSKAWLVTDKTAPLDSLIFGIGVGTTLVREPVGSLDRPMLPVEIDERSGLVVAATGPDLTRWYGAQQDGPASIAPVAPTPSVLTLVHDSFERLLPGSGAPTSWSSGADAPLAATVVTEPDRPGQSLQLSNQLGGPAPRACRALPSDPGQIVRIRAEVTASGRGSGDTRLMTVRGPNGTIASVRISRKGVLGFMGPTGRVDRTFLADRRPLSVTVAVDPTRGRAAISVSGEDGAALVEAADVELLSDPGDGPDEVCFAPAPELRDATITIADLDVESR